MKYVLDVINIHILGEKLHITGLAIGDFEVNLVGENEQDIPFHIKCIFDDVKVNLSQKCNRNPGLMCLVCSKLHEGWSVGRGGKGWRISF